MKEDSSFSIGNKIDITISPDLLESLGKMSVLFVGLEYFIILAISNLIPRTQANFIFRLVGGDNFRVLLSKFKKIFLFQIDDETLIKEFNILYDKLDKIKNDRNKYEHSVWLFNGGNLFRFKIKSSIKKEPILLDGEKLQVSDIEKLNTKIIVASKEIRSLGTRARKSLNKKNNKK